MDFYIFVHWEFWLYLLLMYQKNSPEVIYHVTPTPEPIVQIVTAPRELESLEICNRIDGCPVVEGVCESCEIVKR